MGFWKGRSQGQGKGKGKGGETIKELGKRPVRGEFSRTSSPLRPLGYIIFWLDLHVTKMWAVRSGRRSSSTVVGLSLNTELPLLYIFVN